MMCGCDDLVSLGHLLHMLFLAATFDFFGGMTVFRGGECFKFDLKNECALLSDELIFDFQYWENIGVIAANGFAVLLRIKSKNALETAFLAFLAHVARNQTADSTRQCNFTRGMMREAAMPKCL
jgi:hypothetical protein